jgi:hypothetical protein
MRKKGFADFRNWPLAEVGPFAGVRSTPEAGVRQSSFWKHVCKLRQDYPDARSDQITPASITMPAAFKGPAFLPGLLS